MRIHAAVLFVLAAMSCKLEPQVGGLSLLCASDHTCPDGLRCYDGACVVNTPPKLEPLEAMTMPIGGVIDVTAVANDPEGDPVTFTWVQREGPGQPLLAGKQNGPLLQVTPLVLGRHVFEAVANDGKNDSGAVRLTVQVVPIESSLYVAQNGTDEDGCGTFALPCQSLAHGLALARETGTTQLLLGATTTLDPYRYCLDLADHEVLLGCYDPADWSRDDALRERCRIECDVLGGHHIDDEARLEGVTLAMDARLRSEDVDSPVPALWVTRGQPTIARVQLEAAACGQSCSTGGLLSVDASPLITDVDVRGSVAGFEPLATFVGFYLVGGAPTLTGTPTTRTSGDHGAGNVVLNAPANDMAVGVVAVRTSLTMSGVAITGGLGPSLGGVSTYGGTTDVSGVLVDLVGFGTRSMSGIIARSCSTDSEPCACDSDLRACEGDEAPHIETPTLSARGNDIRLTTGSSTAGLVPCAGVGLGVEAARAGASIEDNAVSIGDDFTLAVGAYATGGLGVVGTLANVVRNNSVTLGSSVTDPLCAFVNGQNGQATDSGAIGIASFSDDSPLIESNDIVVGSSESISVGMYVVNGSDVSVTRNDVSVVTQPSPVLAGGAYGALVMNGLADPASGTFSGNDVQLGGYAAATVALGLTGALDWHVANNFLFGGTAMYTAGAYVSVPPNAGPIPELLHNSIFGGGDPATTLTSRAVLFSSYDAATSVVSGPGFLANNLLDAGEATGRRFVFDNIGFFGERYGNIAQWYGAPADPAPLFAFAADPRSRDDRSELVFHVVLGGSGEVATLQSFDPGTGSVLIEAESRPLLGRPSAGWAGGALNQEAIVAVVPGGLSHAPLNQGDVTSFHIYPTVMADGTVLTPYRAVVAEVSGAFPSDLVFITRAADDAPGAVYMMAAEDGGFAAPEKVGDFPLVDPTRLAVGADKIGTQQIFGVVDDTTLYIGPKGNALDVSQVTRQIGLATAVPHAVGSIDELDFVRFGEEAVGQHSDLDLVIRADGDVYVFINPTLDDDGALTTAAGTDFAPCASGGTVTSFLVGEALANVGATPYSASEVLVGCSGGALEIFGLETGTGRLKRLRVINDDATPVTSLSLVNNKTNDAYFAVLRGGSATLDLYRLATGTLTGPLAYTFLGDIAMRNESTYVADFSSTSGIEAPGTPCDVAMRSGGGVGDLHLSGASNTCVDAGDVLTTPEQDDIDGAGTRSTDVDVGADEVSQ